VKIIVASTSVPFTEGGGTLIVDWLGEALKKHGYNVEVIKIPFHSYPPEMLQQMLALRLLDLSAYGDLLIAIRTPSYIINHPNKVVWFIHHHRGAYDLWGTSYQDIPSTPEGLEIRESIMQADNIYLREAKRLFTNSKRVSKRLKDFNNLDSEVLYPALLNPEQFYCNDYGDYIFYPSRITRPKRQYLAIESMKYTRSAAKLVIAGSPDSQEELECILPIIEKYKVADKVKLISHWIPEDEKAKLYSDSLGCMYIPFDEDSYGYVTLEAANSSKAVITCTDSGGTDEIVENGVNGFMVPPDPVAIAQAIDKLYNNKTKAKIMGQAAREKLGQMNISWDNIVEKLTR
jgi:glycosyltransferase involved in cell wall biosynthesis